MTWLRAALLLCLLGCKAHFESETRAHATGAETVDAAQQVDTHVVDAPDRTTTTVEEFAESDARGDSPGPAAAGLAGAPDPARRLIKRTVTVAEHGAVTIDTHAAAKSQERQDSVLDEQHSAKESFDFLHSPLTWIGAAVVAAGGIYAALKLRKVVPV